MDVLGSLTPLFFEITKPWCTIVTFDMRYYTSYAVPMPQDAGTPSNIIQRTLSRESTLDDVGQPPKY
jgi:hypothetical protein